MKAYLVIDVNITRLAGFMKYVEQVQPLIKKHGGRYLVEGEKPVVVMDWRKTPERIVVLEFPSRDAAQAFLAERGETGLGEMWSQTTKSRILLLDGVQD